MLISRTVFTVTTSYLKKQSRLEFTDKPPEMICEPEFEWQKDMLIEKLQRAIENLSLGESRILTIHMLPGMPISKKCNLAHLPSSTYRYQVDKVISKLRKCLTKPAKFGNPCRKGGE